MFKPVFKPSYMSVIASCNKNGIKIIKQYGYSVAGVTIYNTTNNNITINYFYKDKRFKKHEHVHLIQAKQHRMFSCRIIPLKYLTEIEAYTMENLPDGIYKKIYGDYEECENTCSFS